jgi:hypothetical protein
MLDDMARQRRRAEQAEGLAEPLRNELRQLRAAAEGQAEEIRVVRPFVPHPGRFILFFGSCWVQLPLHGTL